jgi:hypothetical protein
MIANASTLRKNIYRMLDHVADSGTPLIINRRGRLLKIVRENAPAKLSSLTKRDIIKGKPEDLVHMDWSHGWRHDLP